MDDDTPAPDVVRTALLWALEHDREALAEHRETAWSTPRGVLRVRADRRLVERWAAAHGVPRSVARGSLMVV
ncbi:hypothetical protein [Oerskovia flava]|uniref:hypothetical protein n=1 Tax=Oerskovia flava TaxID=2986422 RepID=UPI0022405E66|nr:hypothetical protein [Oerskovia sp. JB1-3-2]